jgi:hypothetical protein
MSILTKFLDKLKVKDVSELTVEERVTYDTYEQALSQGEVTVESIRKFCEMQIDNIEARWRDYGLADSVKAQLIPYHTVYKALILAITGPAKEKERVERELNDRIKLIK